MNFAHLHLLLNHTPIVGSITGVGLFLISLFRPSRDFRRASLVIFAAVALVTIPAFETGVGTADVIHSMPGVSQDLIDRHEGSAMLALWFMEGTGALSLIGLWQAYRSSRQASWNVVAVLLFALLTVGLMTRVGNTGGDIRHPEARLSQGASLAPGQEPPIAEGKLGSIVHIFEPMPEKFTHAMVSSKWWWAFLMDLHFLGLALLIGTIGILDIRMLGFAKRLSIEPLHRLVPWALAGFGVNLITGTLAFIGMPSYYTYDAAFWLKMLTLMLLGLNVAAFYLTGVFDGVEHLKAGEDAPMSAKLVAASSLFLWFAVIILGRYIQLYSDSIPSPQ